MARVKLSDAQFSALQCAGLEIPIDEADELVERAWKAGDRKALVFDVAEAEALWRALNDLSNAEDAVHQGETGAEPEERKFAGRAARSLACVASKVSRFMR